MTKTLTTRVPADIVARVEKISKNLQTEKATLLRNLIIKGLTEIEKNQTLEEYKKGAISFGKMAELLKVSLWDALDILQQHKIYFNYSDQELSEDLEPLLKKT